MAVPSLNRGTATNRLEVFVVHVCPREQLLNKFTNVHESCCKQYASHAPTFQYFTMKNTNMNVVLTSEIPGKLESLNLSF